MLDAMMPVCFILHFFNQSKILCLDLIAVMEV